MDDRTRQNRHSPATRREGERGGADPPAHTPAQDRQPSTCRQRAPEPAQRPASARPSAPRRGHDSTGTSDGSVGRAAAASTPSPLDKTNTHSVHLNRQRTHQVLELRERRVIARHPHRTATALLNRATGHVLDDAPRNHRIRWRRAVVPPPRPHLVIAGRTEQRQRGR